MPKYLIDLSEAQAERLRELTEATGKPRCQFIHAALNNYLWDVQPGCVIMSGGVFISGWMMFMGGVK
jgi:hypothetical protein